MPNWAYSYRPADEARAAKAMAWDIPVHPKVMTEVARAIKGMRLLDAEKYLRSVMELKEPVPFRSASKKVPHRRGLADRWGWPIGKYPVKAASYMLKLLENAANNAEIKNLDVEKLYVVHVGVHKGLTLKRLYPRAFGRADIIRKTRSHVEVVVEERG
ncbi:MAG: 50S ribosomal protein L22 [Acidilobus sp.]|jgi:LSU ribosomal protein L22P